MHTTGSIIWNRQHNMEINTIDLVHSYLTEKRMFGISRSNTKGLNRLRMSHSRNSEIHLAWITAKGTSATVDSVYLKKLSATTITKAVIDLVDPQGLEQLEKVLQTIAHEFNAFNEKLTQYKSSIGGYLTYPPIDCGSHRFKYET